MQWEGDGRLWMLTLNGVPNSSCRTGAVTVDLVKGTANVVDSERARIMSR